MTTMHDDKPTIEEDITHDEDFVFDLTEQVKPVEINNKEGETIKYELREATEDIVARWKDRSMANANVQNTGGKEINVKMGAVGDSDAFLVSLCLFHKGGPYDGHSAGFDEVKSWPSRVVKPMYRWIIKNSNLDLDDKQEKN